MKNIKQIEMGALYLDGAAQANPAYLEAGTIPQYQPDAKIVIGEIPADHSECTITWNEVRLPNGQTLLIANHTLLVDVSYDDLEAAGFVEGQEVTLDGKDYLCRMLRCDKDNHEKDEWMMSLDAVGEDNELWHWQNAASWAIAPTDAFPLASHRAIRGYDSARCFHWFSSSNRYNDLGFRPILVPLEPDSLRPDTEDGCERCKGVSYMMFSADVRTVSENGITRDVPIPVHFCPSCGRKLK